MAWDPNASPWEWDSGAVLQGHGVDFGTRKQSHWPNEVELRISAAKDECPQSGGALFSMEPSTSDIHISVGASEQGNLLSVQQRPRLPIVVAASLANEAFGLDWNESCEGTSARNIVTHKSAADSWKKVSDESTGFLELGSHGIHGLPINKHSPTGQSSKEMSIVADSEGKLPFCPDQQGKLPLGTSHDAIEGGGGGSTEERHSSTTATGSGGSGDSLIGLHLGKRTYFQDVAGGSAGAKASQKATNAGPKKPRSAAGVSQPPRCQVQGCETDLTSAKDYHRRHKVCEPHSKAGKVVVGNVEKRFCQQCSRFHVLSEFDDAKRSCRRRLAGHNERRRKPQIDTSLLNSRFHSTFADWPFLQQPKFHSLSSLWQDTGDFSSNWNHARIGRSDQSTYNYTVQGGGLDQPCLKGFVPPNYDNKYPLLLLQSPKGMMSDEIASSQRAHYHQYISGYMVPVGSNLSLASSTSSSGALAGFSAFETTPVTQVVTRVSDSGCALSLLSLPTRTDHYHASNMMVSRDMSARTTSITFDQLMNEDSTPQQLLHHQSHGRQQLHPIEYTNDKLVSVDSTNTQEQGLLCTTITTSTGGMVDHCEGTLMHGLNIGVGGGFENHMCLATLQEHDEVRAPEDVKQTIDLMPNSSFPSHDAQSLVAFQLGATTPVDLQYTYESSFF